MKKFKYLFLLPAFCLLGTPIQAQERNLTEAEIRQLFEELFLKEESIIDTEETELEDKQREEIADQILYHYTEDLRRKFKHVLLVEDGTHSDPFKVNENRFEYKQRLLAEKKYKNMDIEYQINDIEFMGQKAVVDLNAIKKYETDATDYDDEPKLKADAVVKTECLYHIRIEYDDIARITEENCDVRTFVTNLEVEEEDYKEAERYTTIPPKRLAHYIIDGLFKK